MTNTTATKRFKCPYESCDSCFSKNIRLQAHIRVRHTGYIPFNCPKCDSSFACQTYLNKHLKRHENNENVNKQIPRNRKKREWQCEYCANDNKQVKFHNKQDLRRHQADLHQIRPFKCDQCDDNHRGFLLKSKLNAHKRRFHRGYRCTYDNCTFITDKWSLLRKHMSNDHEKYECNVCMKKYSSSHYLQLHIQSKHSSSTFNDDHTIPVAKYECPHENCDRIYLRKTSLNTHLRTNHCEPKHCCQQCQQKFRHKKSLISHVDRCHNQLKDTECPAKKPNKRKQSKILTKGKLNKLLRLKPVFDPSESVDTEDADDEITEEIQLDMKLLSESNLLTDLIETKPSRN